MGGVISVLRIFSKRYIWSRQAFRANYRLNMRYVAAYLLAVLGGKENPSKDDITKILGSVGISVDDERLASVMGGMKGKKSADVLEEGMKKLASVPSGGGGGGAAPAAAADAPKAAAKKEEKKEESEEEDDEDMGFGLFD